MAGRARDEDNSALSVRITLLEQQLQDMTLLLGTEQEKTLTLLRDKKDVIRRNHDLLKVKIRNIN